MFSKALPPGHPTKLSSALNEKILDFLFSLLSRETRDIPTDSLSGWKGYNGDSENHIFAAYSTYFLAAQELSMNVLRKDLRMQNGYTPSQMYPKFRSHWLHLISERIKKGLLIEVASANYQIYTLAALLNIHDFAYNDDLKDRMRDFLDLIFAGAALESLPNGARGGSQSRKHPPELLSQASTTTLFQFYFNTKPAVFQGGRFLLNGMSPVYLSSGYYPSPVVWELWGKASHTKSYEIAARVPGVGIFADGLLTDDLDPTGAVFRTTYVTPNYVLGSSLLDFNRNYYSINSSEARSISLYMNEGNADLAFADIPQILFGPGSSSCFDKAVAVQKRNALVYQNNIDFYLNGGHRTVGNDGRAKNCYGLWDVRDQTDLIRSQRNYIDSSGNAVTAILTFPEARQYVTAGLDLTRSTNDLSFTGGKFQLQGPTANEGMFLASPGGSTYIWVKPVNSRMVVKGMYHDGASDITKNYRDADEINPTDMRLVDDKFSPIAVVVSHASSYGNSFSEFINDMKRSTLTYANNKATLQPSLRSTLEPDDLFIDSKGAQISGDWQVVSSATLFGDHAIRASGPTAIADLTLNVQTSGFYFLKARVLGEDLNSDSFLVTFAEDSSVNWTFPSISKKYQWHDLNIFRGKNRVFLTARTNYRIRLQKSEAWAGFDSLVALKDRNAFEVPTIEFSENISRTQPPSRINGVDISQSPLHNSQTFFSPFIKSDKDSGVWELRSDNQLLVIDQSALNRTRLKGILMEAESGQTNSSPDTIEIGGNRYLQIPPNTQLEFRVEAPQAGRYNLYIRTKLLTALENLTAQVIFFRCRHGKYGYRTGIQGLAAKPDDDATRARHKYNTHQYRCNECGYRRVSLERAYQLKCWRLVLFYFGGFDGY